MSDERRSINWQAVRDDYESGRFSQSALERKHGVSRPAIKKRAAKEQWVTSQLQVTVTPTKQGVPNRDVNAAIRVARALELRARKHTYQYIADECGYGDASTCRKAIMRELDRVVVDNVKELRQEESYTLDLWQVECSDLFFEKKNKGRLFALDRLLVISKDRRALYNLDKKPDDEVAQQNYIKKIVITQQNSTGGTDGNSNS
jgi:hypothetical protein